MNGLGRRQRNMLVIMRLYGHNRFPETWRLRAEDRNVLQTLQERGLAENGKLTARGEQVASLLVTGMSEKSWKESRLKNELRQVGA